MFVVLQYSLCYVILGYLRNDCNPYVDFVMLGTVEHKLFVGFLNRQASEDEIEEVIILCIVLCCLNK